MIDEKRNREVFLATALAGTITGAMAEAFGEMAKELRTYAVQGSIEIAPLDGIPEGEQLALVEMTRRVIAGLFASARE